MLIEDSGKKKLVVLVIEDSHDWQDVFAQTLRALGAVVLPAINHSEASEALEAAIEQLDLIILDPCIATPSTYDADQILPEILYASRGRRIRIIGCSNDGETRELLKASGCTHVEGKIERALHDVLKEHLNALHA